MGPGVHLWNPCSSLGSASSSCEGPAGQWLRLCGHLIVLLEHEGSHREYEMSERDPVLMKVCLAELALSHFGPSGHHLPRTLASNRYPKPAFLTF